MVRAFTPTPQELEESYTYKDHRIFKISVFEGHITKCNFTFTKRCSFLKSERCILASISLFETFSLSFFSHGIQQSHRTFFFLNISFLTTFYAR